MVLMAALTTGNNTLTIYIVRSFVLFQCQIDAALFITQILFESPGSNLQIKYK